MGLSCEDLARACSTSRSTLYRIEAGDIITHNETSALVFTWLLTLNEPALAYVAHLVTKHKRRGTWVECFFTLHRMAVRPPVAPAAPAEGAPAEGGSKSAPRTNGTKVPEGPKVSR